MSPLINGFIIFSLLVTLSYFIGLVAFLNDHEGNQCEMTYMFQYPQYVRISQEIDAKYPKYTLLAYSEGRLTEKSRNMFFDGIPVLFLPGNAGSHRQARSLASVALRKALNSRSPFHFDHFAIDVNGEYSGLNGALLSDQLDYANSSIYRILDLYKERKNPPKSVILIGHSVGGIIARRLVESLPPGSDLIPIVLTLATPHRRPPLILDSYTYEFYKSLNSSRASNTTFVSLTGGYNDFLVPSFLTPLPYRDTIHVAATTIPRVWVSADHVCVMWCKQLVMALTRAMFDSVDVKTNQITRDHEFRRGIFHHHLVHHNGLSPFLRHTYASSGANIRNHGEWIEHMSRQYTVNVPRHLGSPKFFMVRLIDQPQNEFATIVALNLETIDWVFVCGAHIPREKTRVCEEFTHLSHLSELSPSHHYKRRSLRVNLFELMRTNRDWTHLVVRVLPSDEEVILNVDVFNPADRKVTVDLPNMLSLKRQMIVEETPEKAVHLELVLPTLSHMMQSYQLSVDATRCVNRMRHATASVIVPWGTQSHHKFFVDGDDRPLTVRLYESRPQWASNQSAVIRLTLDPNCRYRIAVRSSIIGMLSQMARFYTPLLFVNVAAVVLMTLHSQLKAIANDRDCSLFFVAIKEGAKPYYILTSVKLMSRFLSVKPIVDHMPAPDWLIMAQEGSDFFLLPLLLYVCSVGIVWILGIFMCLGLVACETTVHKLTLKFLARTVSFTISWSDHVMSALHKLPCVVAAILVGLTLTTTGSLALCVGTVFYFLRLTQLSQDYIEDLVWYYVRRVVKKFKRTKPTTTSEQKSNNNNNNNEERPSHDAVFFHFTVFFLWCLTTAINIPSVLTWAHNFKYSTVLTPDPSFLPGLVLSLCALPLWQLDMPKVERKWYKEIGQFINVLAVASLIYAPISVFRLNYTLPGAILAVTVHQLVAPNRDVEVSREEPNVYEATKAKLE